MSYIATDDITAHKHGGSETSEAAYKKVKPTKAEMWQKVIGFGMTHGAFTVKELAFGLGYGDRINHVSGRISELKSLGMLEETDERRQGCKVIRVKRFA